MAALSFKDTAHKIADYRLVVAVAYRFAALCIKFVGTHKEYDAIDATTIESPP